jgi:hypothetical protein
MMASPPAETVPPPDVAESPLDFPAVMTRQKHEDKGFFLGRTQKKGLLMCEFMS